MIGNFRLLRNRSYGGDGAAMLERTYQRIEHADWPSICTRRSPIIPRSAEHARATIMARHTFHFAKVRVCRAEVIDCEVLPIASSGRTAPHRYRVAAGGASLHQ